MQELVRILDEEIGQLPPQLRGPIVACYLQGKTQDEAAQELGWTVYTLRRRLKRARDLLRARMTGRGATLSAGLLAGALLGSSALAAVPVHLPALTLKVAFAASAGGLVPPAISSLTPGVLGMTGTSSLVIGSGFVATLIAVGYGVGWSMNPTAPALAEPTTPTQISTGPVTPTKFALPTQPKAEIPATQPRPTQPSTQPGSSTPGSDDADPRYATIRGQVIWPRAIPKPQVIDVRTDRPVCCKDGDLLSTELLIDPKSRGIQNVVVWLRPDHDDRTLTFPKDKIHPDQLKPKSIAHTIDQPKCQFEPRVLAARHGDTLTIRNSATINHNVNYSSDVEAFNVIIKPLGQQALKNPLEAQRTPIMVKCDLHPWMSARVRVFDHPYFAVTDAEGRFTLPRVPVGKWRIVYWHEQGYHKGRNGLLGFPVEVTGGKPKILEAVGLELPSL
jgi:plastocyanin